MSRTPSRVLPVTEALVALQEGSGNVTFGWDSWGMDDLGNKYFDVVIGINGTPVQASQMCFVEEKNVGKIAPIDENELARVNASQRREAAPLMLREAGKAPQLQVMRFDEQVVEEEGKPPVYPSDNHRSNWFAFMEIVARRFKEDYDLLRSTQRLLLEDDLPPGTLAPRRPIPGGKIPVKNMKFISPVQTHISRRARANAGMALLNPITRLRIKFDEKTHMPKKCEFYNRDVSYVDGAGHQAYDEMKVDGRPVTNRNIHRVLTSGSHNWGLAALRVCASNMGISLTVDITRLVIQQRVRDEAPQGADLFAAIAAAGGGAPEVTAAKASAADGASSAAGPAAGGAGASTAGGIAPPGIAPGMSAAAVTQLATELGEYGSPEGNDYSGEEDGGDGEDTV